MPPAARLTDLHVCPGTNAPVPPPGSPIVSPGSPNVIICGQKAARVTDVTTCTGPPDPIAKGSPTVLINGLQAARIGDPTVVGGHIVTGCLTVIIGP